MVKRAIYSLTSSGVYPSLVLFVATICAGCDALPPHGVQLLAQTKDSVTRGQYDAGERAANEFLRQFSSNKKAGDAYYFRGMCRINLHQRESGREDFVACAALAGREDLRAKSLAMLGLLAFEKQDYARAADYYAQADSMSAASPLTDEALFRYGVSVQRLGRWQEARALYSRLLHQMPVSSFVAEARRRFAWPHEYFVVCCGEYPGVEAANEAAAVWKQRGRDVTVEFAEADGVGLWRLFAGQYDSYASATADLSGFLRIEPHAVVMP